MLACPWIRDNPLTPHTHTHHTCTHIHTSYLHTRTPRTYTHVKYTNTTHTYTYTHSAWPRTLCSDPQQRRCSPTLGSVTTCLGLLQMILTILWVWCMLVYVCIPMVMHVYLTARKTNTHTSSIKYTQLHVCVFLEAIYMCTHTFWLWWCAPTEGRPIILTQRMSTDSVVPHYLTLTMSTDSWQYSVTLFWLRRWAPIVRRHVYFDSEDEHKQCGATLSDSDDEHRQLAL
jgi:hypothetical protein